MRSILVACLSLPLLAFAKHDNHIERIPVGADVFSGPSLPLNPTHHGHGHHHDQKYRQMPTNPYQNSHYPSGSYGAPAYEPQQPAASSYPQQYPVNSGPSYGAPSDPYVPAAPSYPAPGPY
ncbi:hypothetical protein PFISCL1PPCAC_27111 [Pristionchus fissidentatus]|uniref:Uncharacterized protein n=1 Tax=Pristionchus fissidentatus TaxID=1538716 RepID=A0AAV5X1Z4_9BILA|nr:hypothetical protein PFISCL1PPCAC_27111 [Pristionchus fissidentatus]